MKLLTIVVVALVFGIWFGDRTLEGTDLVRVFFGDQIIDIQLPLFVVALVATFAVLYLVCGWLFSIFCAPKKAKQWNKERQGKNAQNDTLRGYARLIEGDWDGGEKDLIKRLDHCQTPLLNYLGVAYAAQQRQDFIKRDRYLALAEKSDPANRMAVDLTRARMLTQAGDYGAAKTLIDSMHKLAPANKTVLRLMSDVYKNTEDWTALSSLLPKLEKCKAIGHDQLCELDLLARESQMTDALDESGVTTEQEFKALPRKRKTDATMATMYAKKLIQEGDLKTIIRKAISKRWTTELAGLYGKTRSRDMRAQINLATTWLSKHEDDAMVHLSLARLNMANNQVEKAKGYYEKAIKLGAGYEAFYELGAYFEEQGDDVAALSYYKKGLQSVTTLAPALVAPHGLGSVARLDSVVTPGMGEDDQRLGVANASKATKAIEVIEAEIVKKP
jgi:HemY protein